MITRLAVLIALCCTLSAQAASISVTNIIFPTASTWRFFRGTNEASLPDITAWRGTNFADTEFADAPAPFWYGDPRTGGTQLTDMQGGSYTCFFLRRAFTLFNAAQVGGIKFDYFIDDGFIVWINGTEVYRENVGGDPTRFTLAANQPIDPAPLVTTSFAIPPGLLHNGSNWIAIQVFNTSSTSSDVGFDIGMFTIVGEDVRPTLTGFSPPQGTVTSLTQISVTFSEPVQGVSVEDLLINNEQPASAVSGSGSNYTFLYSQPAYGNVSLTWFNGHGITDLSLPPNSFDHTAPGTTWQYTLVDNVVPTIVNLFPLAGLTVRSLGQIEVTFSEEVNGVNAGDLVINSQPATNVTRMPGGPYIFQFASQPAGPVSVQWAGGHGIVDQAAPPNAFVASSWSYTVDPNAPLGDLVINEINAANERGLLDEDTNAVDWIEIYNRGGASVDLAGWSLSDDPAISSLWVFPSRVVGPGEYLVVFASGLDRKTPTGTNRMHTNFKLSGSGEFLGLYNAESPRVLISGFSPEYPAQRTDHSYGIDGLGNLRYFATPTPGGPNGSSSIVGLTEPVHFSSSRGHYTRAFDLVLSCPTPAATIRYTTDGTVPSVINGTVYTAPLRVTNNLFLRASAFRGNLLPSTVETHSYLFNQSAAIRSLPLLSIVTAVTNMTGRWGIRGMTDPSTRGTDGLFITNNPLTDYHNPSAHGIAWEKPVSAELISPLDNSGFQIDCGVRIQGSDWQRPRTLPTHKFSYRLYFRGDYGAGRLEEQIYPLTATESFDQVVVRAGYNEAGNPFIRDELSRRHSHDMGMVTSHGTFWNVFTNGFSAGFFNPCERVHEEMLQSYLGGGSEWDVVGPNFATGAGAVGVIDGDRNDFNNMMTNVWINALLPVTNDAKYVTMSRRLNLVNFADYCILNAYTAMGDWPANNWRAGRERGNSNALWHFIVWDAEWGHGFSDHTITTDSFSLSGTGTLDAGLNSTGNSEIARLYQALVRNREFRLLCADRIHKHFFNGGALTTQVTSNRIQEMRNVLQGHFTISDADLLAWPQQRPPVMMGQFNTYGLYGLSNAAHGFYASSNAPVLSQHGGRVVPGYSLSMTAPLGGTIYYTTNGDDPRVMFTGAVSNSAVEYSAPITLAYSLPIKARTLLNGTNWSAIADVVFEVGTLGVPLRLTEIMYNPPGGSVHEFVELMNIGGAAVSLGGMYFSDGIEFTFSQGASLAPGARLVLANNTDPALFAGQYPGVPVHGYFNGSLNNAGERLTLRAATGEIILSVDYRDSAGWPTAADGGGRSLEVLNVFGGADDPANWRSSPSNGGSPGSVSAPPGIPSIVLNEIMATNMNAVNNGGTFPDFVELHNPGGSLVNLAGWSLSDDGNPRKFVFPSTSIAAGGYLTVWCDTAMAAPGLHTGFALDASSESVFLYDPATNRVDAISLGFQLPNYSVGRVGGNWVLTTPTTNMPNVAAAVGVQSSLSINEWQASSPPGQNDWVEVFNGSGLPVSLHGIYLSVSNEISQLTSLSFIPPVGFMQIFADEGVGPDHVDFRLPAAGATIVLSDATAAAVDSVSYTNATEGVTRGRLPNGSGTFANFPGSASPGASNYVAAYTGPILNEVLARNQGAVVNGGRYADFVELFNPNGTNFPVAGMSLSVDDIEPGQWTFPAGAAVPANGYLVVWCDGGRAASTAPGDYNTGRWLDGDSGGIYLHNTQGQLVNSIEFGFQVVDKSIGLSAGQWRLLSAPTAGAINSSVASLGSSNLVRVNEWMANPTGGNDWFELYNGTNLPVSIGGLILTDDPSTYGLTQFRVPALSFIGPSGFVRWIADGQAGDGRNHVNFALDGAGDTIQLYSTNGANFNLIDSVAFGLQLSGVSQGRLPDGVANIVGFPGSASPGEANYALLPDIVVNEILTHTDAPLEDAVELRNTGAAPVNIGGWFLSDSQDNFKKYRIADGTSIAAGAVLAFIASQFDTGPDAFNFNSAHGEEVWLSSADAGGNLTGYRVGAKFEASANGVSFGRYSTSVGVDYPAMATRTLGNANSGPLIGPVIINELMYNSATSTNGGDDEYIELLNVSGAPVKLFDMNNPGNTWRIEGVGYSFPPNFTLGTGSNVLVVNFDPANATALANFRNLYSVPATVPVLGPYPGRLDNAGESVELRKPDPPQPSGPDAGFVPYILVDRVNYTDAVPWPTGGTNGHVDGGGYSLQRKTTSSYGNEPLNWVASTPTAGAANSMIVAPPVITSSPQGTNVFEGAMPVLSVAATGTGPLNYQWRFNGDALPDETNSTLAIGYAVVEVSGLYDAIVSNPGGSALSASADVVVLVPPVVISPPASVLVNTGATVTLTVVARGTPPLTYQWYHNGNLLPGENSPSITRANVTLAEDGVYEVQIFSPAGMTSASANIGVRLVPVITVAPLSQTVVAGGDVSFSAAMAASPAPYTFYWRRVTAPAALLSQTTGNQKTNFVTFNTTANGFILTNNILSSNFNCRLVISNAASAPGQGTPANITVTVLADSDSDGIPDVWENQHGFDPMNSSDRTLDFDGDGMENWEEYIAGTNPTNAASFLSVSLAASPGSATVSFGAISNRTYSIQFTDQLPMLFWSKLGDIFARTSNRVETLADPAWMTNRFYRVVTPSQP